MEPPFCWETDGGFSRLQTLEIVFLHDEHPPYLGVNRRNICNIAIFKHLQPLFVVATLQQRATERKICTQIGLFRQRSFTILLLLYKDKIIIIKGLEESVARCAL